MSNEAVMHIGAPKCGSTYIQRVLKKNEDELLKRGWSAPFLGLKHPGTDLDFLQSTTEELEKIKQEVGSLVVSHERLFSPHPDVEGFLKRISKVFDKLTVICFVRPIEEIVYGDYSQRMKKNLEEFFETRNPYGGTFEEYVEDLSKKPGIGRNIRRWHRIAGDSFDLRLTSDINSFWQGKLGGALDTEIPGHLANISLAVSDCDEIADRIRNDQDVTLEDLREMRRHAAAKAKSSKDDKGRTAERRKFIREKMFHDIAIVKRDFGLRI